MEIYTEEDFEENNYNMLDSSETQEEENSGKSEYEVSQEEEYDEEVENDQAELSENQLDGLLANSSSKARCTILNEEIRLLKLENNLLISRENSLKQKLELYDKDNETLNTRLMESEKKVANLNKQIELIKYKSDARQTTLENNYRELCLKLTATEETNHKIRFNLNEQKAKNSVLEELVESKNIVIAELERRLQHLTPTTATNLKLNGSTQSYDNVKELNYRLHATEQQLDQVVSELSKLASCNNNFKNSINSNINKYFDYNAMLKEYNSKCVKLKELEERLHTDENKTKVALLEDEIRLLNQKLISRTNTIKENDKELKDFYLKQIDQLKGMLNDNQLRVTNNEQELNKLKNDNQSLIFQLDNKTKTLNDKAEQLENIKLEYNNVNIENQTLKKKLNDLMDKVKNLNMEMQIVLDRENTHMAEFNNYIKDTDLKLKKMELVILHKNEILNQAKNEKAEEDKTATGTTTNNMNDEFKKELMDELSELKQLINSLEKSKKDQQQINNLILTLRHQNDTTIKSIKDENKNILNLIADKNNNNLSELKQENDKAIINVKDKINIILENIKERDENIIKQFKNELDILKNELINSQNKKINEKLDSNNQQVSLDKYEQPELEDKYIKLKESFKNTTASLLKKEKILLDSLKKTVLECHTYKEKLEKLSGSAHEHKKCNCSSMINYKESQLKSFKNCWCKYRNNYILRLSIIRRALICESATLDSIKMYKNKKRII